MSFRAILLGSAITLAACISIASAQAPAPPKPSLEVKKLDMFVGKWTSEGTEQPTAGPDGKMTSGGKFTGTSDCSWVAGGFGVLCRDADNSASMGKSTGVSLLAYDPHLKTYTYSGIDSTGDAVISYGTLKGDTWTWTNEPKVGGPTMQGRMTIKFTSKDAYNFKFEMGSDANSMKPVMEGKQTRVPDATKKTGSD